MSTNSTGPKAGWFWRGAATGIVAGTGLAWLEEHQLGGGSSLALIIAHIAYPVALGVVGGLVGRISSWCRVAIGMLLAVLVLLLAPSSYSLVGAAAAATLLMSIPLRRARGPLVLLLICWCIALAGHLGTEDLATRDSTEPEVVDPMQEWLYPPRLVDAPDAFCGVLISIDTLRLDSFEKALSEMPSDSAIRKFSEEAVRFEQARSHAPWTLPSMASVLTGLPPQEHGAGFPSAGGASVSGIRSDVKTLPELLQESGVYTAGVVSNGYLSPELGFHRGMDTFWRLNVRAGIGAGLASRPLLYPLSAVFRNRFSYNAEAVTDSALALVERLHEGRFWLWAHYIDPHEPYFGRVTDRAADADCNPDAASEPLPCFADTPRWRARVQRLDLHQRDQIRSLYEGDVAGTLAEVDRFLEGAEKMLGERRCMVAVVADHGEEFFEHGGLGHGHTLYDELVRVPYLVKLPGTSGGRFDSLIGTASYTATTLQSAGRTPPVGLHPPVQTLLNRPDSGPEEPGVEMILGAMLVGEAQAGVVRGTTKQLVRRNGSTAVFDLLEDPQELGRQEDPSTVPDVFPIEAGAAGDAVLLRELGYLR